MMKHILKIIWTQRNSNVLIWLELLCVSIFLWYIVDFMFVLARTYTRPLGHDIEHTYLVQLEEYTLQSLRYISPEEKTTTSGQDLLEAVERIRRYPGVEAASISISSYPYNGSNSYQKLAVDTVLGKEYLERQVTPDFFRVFQCTASTGQGPDVLAQALRDGALVITGLVEKELFKGQQATGKYVYFNDDSLSYKIGAVIPVFRYSEFQIDEGSFFRLLSDKELAERTDPIRSAYDSEICIRVNPSADRDFVASFRKEMAPRLQVGNLYLLDVKPFSQQRAMYFTWTGVVNDLKMQTAVLVFLLINIFLGIVGTFWVRTSSRIGEMGLRIALGDTAGGLRRLLISEGVVLLALAAVPALVITFNLGLLEIVEVEMLPFTAGRFLMTTLVTYLLLLGMIFAGIWYPARYVSRIQPAEALHYE